MMRSSAWAPLLGRGGDPGRGRAGQRTPPGTSRLILGQGKGRPFRGGPSVKLIWIASGYAPGRAPGKVGSRHDSRLRDVASEINLRLSLASGPASMRHIDLLTPPLLPVLVPLLLPLGLAAAVERRVRHGLFVARHGSPDTLLRAPVAGAVARPI